MEQHYCRKIIRDKNTVYSQNTFFNYLLSGLNWEGVGKHWGKWQNTAGGKSGKNMEEKIEVLKNASKMLFENIWDILKSFCVFLATF